MPAIGPILVQLLYLLCAGSALALAGWRSPRPARSG